MKPKYLIIHHSGGRAVGAATLDRYHMERALHEPWNVASRGQYCYIGYHKVILPSGKIEQGREDDLVGCHCPGMNAQSLGICLSGNYEEKSMTDAQLAALVDACARLCQRHGIPVENILGHRETASGKRKKTACPGKYVILDSIRKMVRTKLKTMQ